MINSTTTTRSSTEVGIPLTQQQQKQSQLYHTIQLLDEQSMSKTIELIEQKVYQLIMKKALKYKLMQTLKLRKIIDSQDQYRYEDYLQDTNKTIKSNADILDVWIKRNIIQREQYISMKQQVQKANERKARKAAQIAVLIEKIGEKYKGNKVNQVIDKFREMRKANVVRYASLEQQIRSKGEQIKQVIEKKVNSNNNDMGEIKKVGQQMRQYEQNLQRVTTITLDKLDKLLL